MNTPTPTSDQYLTIEEVADYLKIGKSTVYNFLNEEDPLPIITITNDLKRVKLSDLKLWIAKKNLKFSPKGVKCVFCENVIVDLEKDFRDDLSRKEFYISGLCQEDQDKAFESEE